MNLVAFSLWGSREIYRVGALRNALLREQYYPGWTYRFYVSREESTDDIRRLEALGCQIVRVEEEPGSCKFWRHLAAEDPEVERLLVRDIDSSPSLRETTAVVEWVASGKTAHLMRDHPCHDSRVMAGMYGIKADSFRDVRARLRDWLDRGRQVGMPRNSDQPFLSEHLYPRIVGDCLIHDGFSFFPEEKAKEFSTPRIGGEHVGAYVYADGGTDRANEQEVIDAERERSFTRPASESN